MIRGGFLVIRGRRRPYITAGLLIPSRGASAEVRFLVDTGADATLLGPYDTRRLGIDVGDSNQAPPAQASVGQ